MPGAPPSAPTWWHEQRQRHAVSRQRGSGISVTGTGSGAGGGAGINGNSTLGNRIGWHPGQRQRPQVEEQFEWRGRPRHEPCLPVPGDFRQHQRDRQHDRVGADSRRQRLALPDRLQVVRVGGAVEPSEALRPSATLSIPQRCLTKAEPGRYDADGVHSGGSARPAPLEQARGPEGSSMQRWRPPMDRCSILMSSSRLSRLRAGARPCPTPGRLSRLWRFKRRMRAFRKRSGSILSRRSGAGEPHRFETFFWPC